jgi:threonine/homoserine/homoserine lactone efflux protein
MGHKSQDLGMAAACFFFLLLSLAGLLAVLLTGEVKGIDSIFMLMVCAGMALLFAWLTFSALQDAGLFGAPKSAEEPSAAPNATEGKQHN